MSSKKSFSHRASSNHPYSASHMIYNIILLCVSIQSLTARSPPLSPEDSTAKLRESSRVLHPSLAIAMITGANNGSIEDSCLVHFDSDKIPSRMQDAQFVDVVYLSSTFCNFHPEPNSSVYDVYRNKYLLINYDKDCPLNQTISVVKQSYPLIKGKLNFSYCLLITSFNPSDCISLGKCLLFNHSFALNSDQGEIFFFLSLLLLKNSNMHDGKVHTFAFFLVFLNDHFLSDCLSSNVSEHLTSPFSH